MRPGNETWELAGGHRQRGAVLLFTLVALVVMLVAGAAWARMFNSSLLSKSNLALKRDMENQSERGVDQALAAFRTGGPLSTTTARGGDLPTANYSATILASDARGVPNVLALGDSAFAASYRAVEFQSDDKSVKFRYVVDRLCATTGDEASLGPAACVRTARLASGRTESSDPKEPDRAEPCPALRCGCDRGNRLPHQHQDHRPLPDAIAVPVDVHCVGAVAARAACNAKLGCPGRRPLDWPFRRPAAPELA